MPDPLSVLILRVLLSQRDGHGRRGAAKGPCLEHCSITHQMSALLLLLCLIIHPSKQKAPSTHRKVCTGTALEKKTHHRHTSHSAQGACKHELGRKQKHPMVQHPHPHPNNQRHPATNGSGAARFLTAPRQSVSVYVQQLRRSVDKVESSGRCQSCQFSTFSPTISCPTPRGVAVQDHFSSSSIQSPSAKTALPSPTIQRAKAPAFRVALFKRNRMEYPHREYDQRC